jgi:DNA-binding transcriptional ArsR family regulator
MSFAAVQKHVAVLETAGLVSKERRGRECLVQGNLGRLEQARELLAQLEELWRARFGRIDALFTDSIPQE